jgi:hypothetical protein
MAAGWAIGSGIALILLALTSYIIAAVSQYPSSECSTEVSLDAS